ncbi:MULTISPECIES: SIR2 family protein [Gordonia]|uniref:SIR2 family protein n=1 Tax=Gordonia TaxID=2053 RepID=UPI0033982766
MTNLQSAMNEVERDAIAARLAGYLRSGQVSLLLGAGVSTGLNLPDWRELVEACENDAGVTPDPDLDLLRRMDHVRISLNTHEEYADLVKENLYKKLSGTNSYPDDLLRNRMLISIGALVMSSVRGSVTEVLTLNFDDVLDWYLHLHGFRTQVITNLPALVAGNTDVRIMHMHGFLPLMPRFERSDWMLLSHDSLIDRLRDHTAPWPVAIGSIIQSKILLAVGTSLGDTDLDVLLAQTARFVSGQRPVGYVLAKDVSSSRVKILRERGIETVSFSDYKEVPEFLLNVCQRAAADSSLSVGLSS